MSKYRGRRRRIVINNAVQSRIIMSISWPPAITLALTALLLSVFCMRLSDEALEADVDLPSIIPVFMTVSGFLGIATLFILLNALRFSHRIAGPIYRLKETLQTVRDGDIRCRANLRKGDFLEEVAQDMNDFLDWLEQHPPEGMPEPPAREPGEIDQGRVRVLELEEGADLPEEKLTVRGSGKS